MNPKELNKAIQREHYGTRYPRDCNSSPWGNVLHRRNGFWHVALDRPSSLFTQKDYCNDDFVVVGYGDTTKAAIQDHDKL